MTYYKFVSSLARYIRIRHIEVSASVILCLFLAGISLWTFWDNSSGAQASGGALSGIEIKVAISAVLLATIGWIVQSVVLVTNHRAENAVNMLQTMRADPEYNRHRHKVFGTYPPRTNMSEQEAHHLFSVWRHPKLHESDPDLSDKKDLVRSLTYLLNYYDFVALCIRSGHSDMELIANSQRTVFTHFHEKAESFINKARTDPGFGGQQSWRHFVWLVQQKEFDETTLDD